MQILLNKKAVGVNNFSFGSFLIEKRNGKTKK